MIYPFNTKLDLPFEEKKELLGGKGAGLNRMQNAGFPVPLGFTIPTNECASHTGMAKVRESLFKEVRIGISDIEKVANNRMFGSPSAPLLFSVRSGAKFSMPGMMDTVLNIGLNDQTVVGLAKMTNEDFAYDSYRRFLQMYGTTVLGIPDEKFHELYAVIQDITFGLTPSAALSKLLIEDYKEVYEKHKKVLPMSVWKQLDQTIMAVFRSWNSKKAKAYRKVEGIPNDIGTAVNIQQMVFGNMNNHSGTGVVFTRNPNTGEPTPYGDFLVNAQGEDVVAGTHETLNIEVFKDHFPAEAKQLNEYMNSLEITYKDMCDIEFTVENNKLWILQVRVGKRSPQAALRIASDLVSEGIISQDTATERVKDIQDVRETKTVSTNVKALSSGLGACPGVATGVVAFTSDQAVKLAGQGKKVILVREQTDPNDIEGMAVSEGILTALGGLVSHAAVVARGWGKVCVVGCSDIIVSRDWDDEIKGIKISDKKLTSGKTKLTIDGTTGEIWIS